VVGLQPSMELLGRFKRLALLIAHVLIAVCAYFTQASGLFGFNFGPRASPSLVVACRGQGRCPIEYQRFDLRSVQPGFQLFGAGLGGG
jgi:hypothetical protein